MDDLIDRNELINNITQFEDKYNIDKYDEISFGFACVTSIIKQLPQADTEQHAHWIKTDDGNYICSNCHCEAPNYKVLLDYDNDYYEVLTDFCPNCGYKMNKAIK